MLQYDGSKDDLDWRIGFRYFDFILFIKKIEIYANKVVLLLEYVSFSHSSTCDLTLLRIGTSFFNFLTRLKFLHNHKEKESAQLDYFYSRVN